MPATHTAKLILKVNAGEGADTDELDRVTLSLAEQIRDLDVQSVEMLRAGPAPEGSKTAEALTWGALALAVMPAAVPQVIEFLKSWSLRSEGRTVKVKAQRGEGSLEVEYNPSTMSQAELKELVSTLTEALAKSEPGQ